MEFWWPDIHEGKLQSQLSVAVTVETTETTTQSCNNDDARSVAIIVPGEVLVGVVEARVLAVAAMVVLVVVVAATATAVVGCVVVVVVVAVATVALPVPAAAQSQSQSRSP